MEQIIENLADIEMKLSELRDDSEKDNFNLSEAHRKISEALTLLGRE